MISTWHLVWIVPLAACFGLLVGCMLAAAGREDRQIWCDKEIKENC